MNKRKIVTTAVLSSLLILAILIAPMQQALAAMTQVIGSSNIRSMLNRLPAHRDALDVNGSYSGSVKLMGTARGVYSDTLTAAAGPDLGNIDLALQLTATNQAISGYVDLSKTLVFTTEHTLAGNNGQAVGPYVNGTFDGNTLSLESERITATTSGKAVQRQFRVLATLSADQPNQLSGEYRETIWGYAREPITVLGNFTLARPAVAAAIVVQPSNGGRIYLPVTSR